VKVCRQEEQADRGDAGSPGGKPRDLQNLAPKAHLGLPNRKDVKDGAIAEETAALAGPRRP